MNEPRASEPRKKTIVEHTFYFVGGTSTVVAVDAETDTRTTSDDKVSFRLKDRLVFVSLSHVLWEEKREYQVPVKEPVGPPQVQQSLL